ncbi:MAG: hypothetical protein AAFY71_12685 [Bacteroidota bacterium]
MNRNYIIVIALGIATLIAFLLLNYFSKPAIPENSVEEVEELKKELAEVDQNVLELEIISETQGTAINSLQGLLDEKYTQIKKYEEQINEMQDRVNEMEKQGSLDQETIDELKAKIAESRTKVDNTKGELLDDYRKEMDILVVDIARVTRGMDSIVIEKNTRDSLLVARTNEIERYQKKILDCADAKNINEVEIPKIPILNAVKFKVSSIKKNSPELIQAESVNKIPRLDRNRLERLNVCFNLEGNELVSSGSKKLYMFLKNKRNRYYTSTRESGTTVKEGKNMTYTRSSEVSYRATSGSYEVCMDFIPDDSDRFSLGVHTVEIVHDGKIIGTTSFWLK